MPERPSLLPAQSEKGLHMYRAYIRWPSTGREGVIIVLASSRGEAKQRLGRLGSDNYKVDYRSVAALGDVYID